MKAKTTCTIKLSKKEVSLLCELLSVSTSDENYDESEVDFIRNLAATMERNDVTIKVTIPKKNICTDYY